MKKSILIVEDDEAIRSTMSDLLEMEGYTIYTSENGQEALNFLSAPPSMPDLILLDLMMPILDGFGFCEAKEKSAEIAQIPVIIMSADGNIRQKQTKTHALGYLKKPVDIDEVLKSVRDALY